MTDSISLKLKPGAAILMALALITTTFAGVSFADPSTDSREHENTQASMDYDELDLIVDFNTNGTVYGNLTAEIHVTSDDNFSASFGPVDMMEESDNTSWNTHWADIDLTLFFAGSTNASPMADEGTWYFVEANVYSEGNTVGSSYTEICMENGSVCEMNGPDNGTGIDDPQEEFDLIDADGDGAINATELIDYENSLRAEENLSAMDADEESDLLAKMADYDLGWESMDGNDTEDAGDGMLEFNEFMDFYFNEHDMNGPDDGTGIDDPQEEFDLIDADGDGAINATELIDYENSLRAEENLSAMDADEESDLLAKMADYDLGWESMDGNDTEDAGDGMLEFNEFMDFYFNEHGMEDMTDYDLRYDDDGDNQTLEIHINDGGDYGYTFISIMDLDQNEVYNTTFNTTFWMLDLDENNLGDSMYVITITIYDHMGDKIYMSGDSFGETDNDQMMFDMYDTDMSGTISVDEFLHTMDNMSQMNGEDPMDNATKTMMSNLFMSEDNNSDGELDFEEFLSFWDTMNNMGDDNDGNDESDEIEFMMMMLDADGDGNLSLTEMMATNDDDETVTFVTNVFNHNDFNGDGMLDLFELAMFIAHMDEMDSDNCYDVKAGDTVMEDGELFENSEADNNETDDKFDLVAGENAPIDGEFCPESDNLPSGEYLVFYADLDGDGNISLFEVLALLNNMKMDDDGEPLSDLEEEWLGIAFMMNDRDGNEHLDEEEFTNFFYQINQDDDEGHDEGNNSNGTSEPQMVCYDMTSHTLMMELTIQSDCEAAGYLWADMNDQPGNGDDNNQDDNQDDNQEDMLQFYDVDVRFEQWNDQSIDLVITELAVLDNPEEIARLVMMADAEYGNNDSVLDQSEVDMLMGLYAMTLNPDDMAEGLTLDGQNGTAIDFWVEVDGLLEGNDVVFLRLATVIQFPTTAYDNSTSHTFMVSDDNMDEDAGSSNDSMEDSMPCEDEEIGIWIHNSETWSVSSAITSADGMGFTYDETNDMWYAKDDGCSDVGTVTFILDKTENGTLPGEQDDDWTWEEEEMNMFPICSWYYAVTLANGTMMEDQWMDEAPQSGDYMITLVDNASYDIYVSCWDPEGGKMVLDITSPLGNSSNTSIGEAKGHIAFKIPAGTGGNVTFDVSWTDGYHNENSTLTVYATGDGTLDLSDIDVDEAEGLLPGFTVGLGVVAMLGAAMIAGRRNEA